MEVNEKSVLLMLSGGRDSFLVACRLIESGHRLHMVTYDNGCGFQPDNARTVADRIIERFGSDKAEFLGIKSITGTWRRFFPLILNMKPSAIAKKYGEITYSQFNCLTCRTAMYIYTISLGRRMGIKYIAEGARKAQGFVIELEEMIEQYRELLCKYNIELLLPVYDLDDNWSLKNELMEYHFVPKTLEPQCILGFPLDVSVPDRDVIDGTVKFFIDAMKDKIAAMIENVDMRMLDGRGELND